MEGDSAAAASVQNTLAQETDHIKGENFVPSLRPEGRRKKKVRQTTSYREIEDKEADTVNANFTSLMHNVS